MCVCTRSLCQSGSTTGTQTWLATGCSTPKLGPKEEFSPTSSWTGWSGSSPSRTWRSGPSTRSEFRPSTGSARAPGARRSTEGRGNLVRRKREWFLSNWFQSVDLHVSRRSSFQRTGQRVGVRHHLQQHPGAVGGGASDRSQRPDPGIQGQRSKSRSTWRKSTKISHQHNCLSSRWCTRKKTLTPLRTSGRWRETPATASSSPVWASTSSTRSRFWPSLESETGGAARPPSWRERWTTVRTSVSLNELAHQMESIRNLFEFISWTICSGAHRYCL